ncbi:hypothetical protein [Flavitalea sp.]|nr:hypothetical protein [Flavitalea sp.]
MKSTTKTLKPDRKADVFVLSIKVTGLARNAKASEHYQFFPNEIILLCLRTSS